MTRWAMVIDLTRCIGCKACMTACSQANNIPEGMWRKLHVLPETLPPERGRTNLTRSCMHCDTPYCLEVCPTGATFKRADGIVEIDARKCIGCSYCILACPYDARTIYRSIHQFETQTACADKTSDAMANERQGTCTKCNFCATRIDNGLVKGLKPGVDDEATPMCVVTCSCGALNFGDLDDPESEVSRMIAQHEIATLFSGVETGPAVFYILV